MGLVPILAIMIGTAVSAAPKWLKKFGMSNFGRFELLTIFLHQYGWEKFGTPNFGRFPFAQV